MKLGERVLRNRYVFLKKSGDDSSFKHSTSDKMQKHLVHSEEQWERKAMMKLRGGRGERKTQISEKEDEVFQISWNLPWYQTYGIPKSIDNSCFLTLPWSPGDKPSTYQ